jgi:hypothetical protein
MVVAPVVGVVERAVRPLTPLGRNYADVLDIRGASIGSFPLVVCGSLGGVESIYELPAGSRLAFELLDLVVEQGKGSSPAGSDLHGRGRR